MLVAQKTSLLEINETTNRELSDETSLCEHAKARNDCVLISGTFFVITKVSSLSFKRKLKGAPTRINIIS